MNLPEQRSATAHGASGKPRLCLGLWVLGFCSVTAPASPISTPSGTPGMVHSSGCPAGEQLQHLLLMLHAVPLHHVGVTKLRRDETDDGEQKSELAGADEGMSLQKGHVC